MVATSSSGGARLARPLNTKGKAKGKAMIKANAKAKGKAKVKPKLSKLVLARRLVPSRRPSPQEAVIMRLKSCRIVPVIKIQDASHAVPLVKALKAGGIDVAEITYRTASAAEAIREVCRNVDGMCIGAGTVLSAQQADEALQCGADFIVSPGFDPAVARRCRARGVLYLPGVVTPMEAMMVSTKFNLKVLKFFPAASFGGVGALKSYAAVFPDIAFMPTGGVTETNLTDFLSLPNVLAAGGSWMVTDAAIQKAGESGDWSAITAAAFHAGEVARASGTA